jgi:hypothetical protein
MEKGADEMFLRVRRDARATMLATVVPRRGSM